jgi:hypothetical protein
MNQNIYLTPSDSFNSTSETDIMSNIKQRRFCVVCLKKREDYYYRFPKGYYDIVLLPRNKERVKEKWLWCRRCYVHPDNARFRDDPADIETPLAQNNNNNNRNIDDSISRESMEVEF